MNRAILGLYALLSALPALPQGEELKALSARPAPEALRQMQRSDERNVFIYQNATQTLPIVDDFSVDRTRKLWAQPSDPDVTLDQTIYALEVDGLSDPDMRFSTDTTFTYVVDIGQPDTVIVTVVPLPEVLVLVRNLNVYPPTEETVTAWPPYNVYDTLQTPPADTIALFDPQLTQDSLFVYSVAPDPRIYIRADNSQAPWTLWADDDVHVNGTYPVAPPTIGVATFDGLARTGYPYNFGNFSAYGIADRLTSVPIDLSYSVADSVYLSFLYQAQGLSGDQTPQPQDSLVLEFYSPSEDSWNRVWRTPYPNTNVVQPFQQVMVPIKEFRYLQNGFRMRFLNYATLSGSFDHWHLDYVRLGTQRTFDDTTFVDVAYLYPESSLLGTYTSIPFNRFSQAPAAYMAQSVDALQRNLDDVDRFITWRMRAGIDGEPLPAPSPFLGNNTSGNASQVFNSAHAVNSPPNNLVYDPSLSTDAAFWQVQFITNATPDVNRYNDTITFVQELSNYYAYDDGSAEMGYGLNVTGGRLAYRFDLLGGDSLRAIRMYFNPMANEPPLQQPLQGNFLITIWSSLSPEVIQHQNFSFSSPEYRLHGLNKFVEYPLDSAIYVEGTIYIGWVQTSPANMNLGFDRNRNNGNKIFFKVGSSWQNTSFQGSLMMRPVFVSAEDPFTSVDELPLQEGRLLVFPNPATDHYQLHMDEDPGAGAYVLVHDALGRELQRTLWQPGMALGTAGMANGLHLVRVMDRQGSMLAQGRLMIQR